MYYSPPRRTDKLHPAKDKARVPSLYAWLQTRAKDPFGIFYKVNNYHQHIKIRISNYYMKNKLYVNSPMKADWKILYF